MFKRVTVVLLAAAVYAASLLAAPTVLGLLHTDPSTDDLLLWLPAVGLLLVLACIGLVVVALWVCAATGDYRFRLPLLAWWLGSVAASLIDTAWVMSGTPRHILARSFEAATLWVLVPTASSSHSALFSLAGQPFRLGVPIPAMLILAAVYVRAPYAATDGGRRRHVEQADQPDG